jgi:hypothetical protein
MFSDFILGATVCQIELDGALVLGRIEGKAVAKNL